MPSQLIRTGIIERSATPDSIRGVATFDVLLLNVSAFGLPKAAYLSLAWYGDIVLSDAWTWALLGLFTQVKFLMLSALLFGAGLQILLPRGKCWIQSWFTLLVLSGSIHGLLFWGDDILLVYGSTGLICQWSIRDAPSVESLFNIGVVLYLAGVSVLLLLGMISESETSRAWTLDTLALLYGKYQKVNSEMEAASNRVNMMPNNLLALGTQYGWQLAGMMLLGAASTHSGWLKGQYSLQHHRRTGALLAIIGMVISLPTIIAQQHLDWAYRWRAFPLQAPRELGAPLQTIGYVALMFGFWPQLNRLRWVIAIACVGRMALANYLLQTLTCTTLFYQAGLFIKFDRLELLFFIIPVWAISLLFSVTWLRFYRQGPMGWLWRQLTLRTAGTSLPRTSR